MPAKVIFVWSLNNVALGLPAISETHYYSPAVTSARDTTLNTNAVALMNARTLLMGSNVQAEMYRVSIPGVRKRSYRVIATPTLGGGTPIVQSGPTANGNSDGSAKALQVEFVTANNPPIRKWMGGLPDSLFVYGASLGPNFAGPGGSYQGNFQAYITLLTTGSLWGTNVLQPLPANQPVAIGNWQQGAAPNLNAQIVLPNTAAFLPAINQIVHIRGVLISGSTSKQYWGKYKIVATGAVDANNTFFELGNSAFILAVTVDANHKGTVEQVSYGVETYTAAQNYQQGSHKRGIGPVRPRGRSRRPSRRQAF